MGTFNDSIDVRVAFQHTGHALQDQHVDSAVRVRLAQGSHERRREKNIPDTQGTEDQETFFWAIRGHGEEVREEVPCQGPEREGEAVSAG